MLVSSTPDTTVPVASACDLGEVPCISTVAPWQPHYLGIGGELGPDVEEPPQASAYNWHFFWGLEDVIENFVALWEQSGASKVVGGLWPNDPDGNAWSDANTGFPPALEAARLKTQMLLQVHDELVFESPEAEADAAAALIKRIMEEAPLPAVQLSVPITVDARSAKNWAAAH